MLPVYFFSRQNTKKELLQKSKTPPYRPLNSKSEYHESYEVFLSVTISGCGLIFGSDEHPYNENKVHSTAS